MRRFWLSYPEPNKAVEPTPYSLRLASAFGRGSPLAFGVGLLSMLM
jgi:hypothetical protein